jgi:hypothetical protein
MLPWLAYFCRSASDDFRVGTVHAVLLRLPGSRFLFGSCKHEALQHLQCLLGGKSGASTPTCCYPQSLRSEPEPLCSSTNRGWRQSGDAGGNVNSFLAAGKDFLT